MTRPAETPSRPCVSKLEKHYILANFLRNPAFFVAAKPFLRPEILANFTEDLAYLIVLRAVFTVAQEHSDRLPDKPELGEEHRHDLAHHLIDLEVIKLSDSHKDSLVAYHWDILLGEDGQLGLVDWIYSLKPSELSEPDAMRLLMRFLEERIVDTEICKLADRINNISVPKAIRPFLEQIEKKQAQIQSLGVSPAAPQFLQLDDIPDLSGRSTGVTFMDRILEIGRVRGEMYTIMASTGAGKTLLANQLFMAGSLTDQSFFEKEPTKPLGHSYYFCFEDFQGFRYRMWAYAAEIAHSSFKNIKRIPLSTTGNLKEYEKKHFAAALDRGEKVPGEVERLANAEKKWGQYLNFWPVNFSGSDPNNPEAGAHGLDDVVAFLEHEIQNQRTISQVFIDHGELLIDRMIVGGVIDSREKYKELNVLGQRVVNRVVEHFGPTVWLLHQLHGDTGKRSPTAMLHHSEAMGARNFVNGAWFAIQIGNQDPANHCTALWVTKTRDVARPAYPTLVQIDGAIMRMVDADPFYQLSPGDHKIRLKSELHTIVQAPMEHRERQILTPVSQDEAEII